MSGEVGNESQLFQDLHWLASRDLDTAEKIEAAVIIGLQGLGLLIVHRIVAGHGWQLSIATSDAGTSFEITGVNVAPPTHDASDQS